MYRIILSGLGFVMVLFTSMAHAGQDPMRPPNWGEKINSSPEKNKSINLQQILISKDRKLVIINDKVLREGQSVSGYRIMKIEAAEIRIRRAGVNEIIKLLPVTKGENREI